MNETTKNNWFLTNTGIIEVKFTNDSYSIENKFNYGKIDFSELKDLSMQRLGIILKQYGLGSKDSKLIRWSPKVSRDSGLVPNPLIKEIITGENLHNVYGKKISYNIVEI